MPEWLIITIWLTVSFLITGVLVRLYPDDSDDAIFSMVMIPTLWPLILVVIVISMPLVLVGSIGWVITHVIITAYNKEKEEEKTK